MIAVELFNVYRTVSTLRLVFSIAAATSAEILGAGEPPRVLVSSPLFIGQLLNCDPRCTAWFRSTNDRRNFAGSRRACGVHEQTAADQPLAPPREIVLVETENRLAISSTVTVHPPLGRHAPRIRHASTNNRRS